MNQLTIHNADDLATNTESVIILHLRFRHDKTASEAEATTLSREALIDYCQAYNLDIYEHDERGVRTNSIDQAKIIPALEAYLLGHILTVVASHRGSKAEQQAKVTVAQTLQASE